MRVLPLLLLVMRVLPLLLVETWALPLPLVVMLVPLPPVQPFSRFPTVRFRLLPPRVPLPLPHLSSRSPMARFRLRPPRALLLLQVEMRVLPPLRVVIPALALLRLLSSRSPMARFRLVLALQVVLLLLATQALALLLAMQVLALHLVTGLLVCLRLQSNRFPTAKSKPPAARVVRAVLLLLAM